MWVFWWVCFGAMVGLIAKSKGFSWLGWFVYGFALFPVALVHVLVKPARGSKAAQQGAAVDTLVKLDQLRQSGGITTEEYADQKARLLTPPTR